MPRSIDHGSGRWISATSLGVVVAWIAAAIHIEPASQPRAELHVQVVLTLGYGHLLASVVRGRSGSAGGVRGRELVPILLLAASYAIYVALCRHLPLLPLVLLAVSTWHTVENDRALRRTHLLARRPIAPMSTRRRDVLADLGGAAALGALALATPLLTRGIDGVDVVAAASLHHLVSWLLLTLARARLRQRLGAELAALARLHLPMIGACALSVAAVAARGRLPAPLVACAETLLSPATYLFWSSAHVVHTAWRRTRP